MIQRFILLTCLLSAIYFKVDGQTCCSGGVPLSSNIGLPMAQKHAWQWRLSYDLNVLNTLKSGLTKLDDRSRNRKTHSTLIELGFQISDRWSLDALFSYVRQVRKIRQFGNVNETSTNGLGDMVFLLRYQLTKEKAVSAYAGIGVKAPTGPSALKTENGLTIVADLQPGSGAWDLLFWNQLAVLLPARPSLNLSLQSTYSRKGINPSYLGNQAYQFGEEWQTTFSATDRILIKNQLIDPSIGLRYRYSGKDQINENNLASTSGHWVFVSGGFGFWLNSKAALHINTRVPIFAYIEGTQLSPSWQLNIGFHQAIY